MKICRLNEELLAPSIYLEKSLHKLDSYDCIITSNVDQLKELPKDVTKVFWGDLNQLKSYDFDYFYPKEMKEEEVLKDLQTFDLEKEKDKSSDQLYNFSSEIKQIQNQNLALQKDLERDKEESLNIKGLGEYVIRLLGVNTMEQLVYETESLRILKYKGIKVSLIYIDSDDAFLCTRNTTRKIKNLKTAMDWNELSHKPEELANILSRPVLNHLKVYSEKLDGGDQLHALFESQEEFLEKDFFLNMLQKLLFTNFLRVLQSERLLKNSSLLSQAFQQIQNTSLLIGSDYTILFSNQKNSVDQKCYRFMFGLNEPCKACPIKNGHEDRETMGKEVKLNEQAYTVHSSRVKNLSNNFYLHIYETEENSQKRESIKIQRGKLQSLGLVTQALTHELNNPLTGILELSQDLETEFQGQTAEDLREINLASKRCIDIIENLKNFSSRKIRFSRVNFSGAIKSALVLTKVLTRNTNVQVDLDEEIWISGSKTLLSQIIFNIIKNSVEASGKGGEIKISLKRAQDRSAVLVLEDNGPGLPAGMNEVTLFGTQNKEKGTGYGLFLVNEFVKLHKGKLSFGNLPGGGAYFKIVVPMT